MHRISEKNRPLYLYDNFGKSTHAVFMVLYISLFHHKHGSTNNKQYIIKRINTTHTHARTHTQKLMSADD